MPVIVMKIDTRDTAAFADDRLLPGATFELHQDDGDGVYQPNGADTEVSFQGVTIRAFLAFQRPAAVSYWLVESRAPVGYERAEPELVPPLSAQDGKNCVVLRERVRCFTDDDGISGFVLVVVPDDPAHLPPTDTDQHSSTAPQMAPAYLTCGPAIFDGRALPRRRCRRKRAS